ncbi:hypothetical protein OAA41_00785, partial [bacterium]|nr:hypothetical protein [bacterium]
AGVIQLPRNLASPTRNRVITGPINTVKIYAMMARVVGVIRSLRRVLWPRNIRAVNGKEVVPANTINCATMGRVAGRIHMLKRVPSLRNTRVMVQMAHGNLRTTGMMVSAAGRIHTRRNLHLRRNTVAKLPNSVTV